MNGILAMFKGIVLYNEGIQIFFALFIRYTVLPRSIAPPPVFSPIAKILVCPDFPH
jgi:hypothetical protein